MENIYRNLLLLALFSAQVATVSAQSAVAGGKELAGTWHMDTQGIVDHMDQEDKVAFESLPDSQRERFVGSLSSRVFIFSGNGGFSATWKAHGKNFSAHGKWMLEGDGKLKIVFPTGISEYRASFPSADKMVLEPLNSTGGMAKRLYFIKDGKP